MTQLIMPFGYLCPLGIYVLGVFMPLGYLCPLGIYALWVQKKMSENPTAAKRPLIARFSDKK